MEIRIKTDAAVLVISDERLDNDNFVGVRFENIPVDVETNNTTTEDVLIDDLMGALIAFDSKRSRRMSREHPDSL